MAGSSGTYSNEEYIEVSITFEDGQEEKSVETLRYGYGDGSWTAADAVTAVIASIPHHNAVTNAVVQKARIEILINGVNLSLASPADGSFISVDDSQKTTFQVADGETKLLSTPAPIASMFQSDLETVDTNNATYQAWVADVLGLTIGGIVHEGQDEDGQQLDDADYGLRQWRRRKHTARPA